MAIQRSTYPPLADCDLTITERIFRDHDAHQDDPAIIDGLTGDEWTIGALHDRIRRLAGGLQARGHGAGTTVAIMAPNLPDYVTVFHAVGWAGGTITTINPSYTAPEVHHQLADTGATLLITVAAFLDTARAAAQNTAVQVIVTLDPAPGVPSLDDLFGPPQLAQTPVNAHDHVAVLPYSSGTTGLPKGVMLTHRNLTANVDQCIAVGKIARGERCVSFLPFFHIYGQTLTMNCYLAAGGVPITMPRFELETFLRLNQTHRTTRAFVVPPVMIALAKHPMVDQFDMSSLRIVLSGAAPAGASLSDMVAKRLNVQAVQGYGMTEVSPVSHCAPYEGSRPGSVGVLVPGMEARIVDPETLADLAPGHEGEVWLRGPNVMKGYHRNPEATARMITPDGWLRTGDLGVTDADGYLTICDRLKELIKVKGFQVAPAEVEAALLTCPGVADAAVVGRPDDEAGEVPVAFVVAQKDLAPTEDAVLAHLAAQLASYKLPRFIRFVDTIPKSASGKILRRMLS